MNAASARAPIWRGVIRSFQFPRFQFSLYGGDGEAGKLLWIVRLRYPIVAAQILLVLPALHFGYLHPHGVPAYLAMVFALLFANLFIHRVWLSRKSTKVTNGAVAAQLLLDLFVLSILLAFTGGLANPFITAFAIHAALGGMLLHGSVNRAFMAGLVLLLSLVQIASLTPIFFHPRLLAPYLPQVIALHVVCWAAWLVGSSLGRHLKVSVERLENLRAENERLDRLRGLGALAAGISHELASPLNTMKLRLNRLQRRTPELQESEDIRELSSALQECEAVIRMMNGAQLDPRQFRFESVDLVQELKNALRLWCADHPEVQVETEWSELPRLRIPRLNFAQAVMNLLDNALDASLEGGKAEGPLWVRAGVTAARDAVVVEIADPGPGFPEEVAARMGEPFNTSKETGTGLGLYTTQLFMSTLSGTVTFAREGHETRVGMRFPMSLEKEAEKEEGENQ